MSTRVQKVREALTPAGSLTDWQMLHAMIAERIRPGMSILEVGCGRGEISPFPWKEYSGEYLVGIDPDPTASENPYLDRFVHLKTETDLRRWPLDDHCFDLVIARYVLEHVSTPPDFLHNVNRVLKPEGKFLFLTPNLRHPAVRISKLLPTSIKERILSATHRLDSKDVFPTHYRMNTPAVLEQQLGTAGFLMENLTVCEPQPIGYLDFSVPTFYLAYGYYRFLKWSAMERRCGFTILGVAQSNSAA